MPSAYEKRILYHTCEAGILYRTEDISLNNAAAYDKIIRSYGARILAEVPRMDISFKCDNQKFNYRVCAMIIANNRILAMHDERSPYFYLPGGRVALGETAEQAVVREVREELEITAKIIRPVWLNQAFFTEDVDNLRYHELCIYF